MTKRELIELFGSAAKVAEFFDITDAAVSQWDMDEPIPELRMWQGRHKRPDLFGPPQEAA